MTTWRTSDGRRAPPLHATLPLLSGLALLLPVGLALALGAEPGWPTFTLLWLIGALTVWGRSRPARRLSTARASRLSQGPWAPLRLALMSLFLDSAMVAALREWDRWPLLLLLNGLWALAMLLTWRLTRQRRQLAIGVFDTDHTPLPSLAGSPLRYVPVRPGSQQPLEGLDVLLSEQEAHSEPQRRLLAHAAVTGLPIWSRSGLEEDLSGKVALEQMNIDWMRAVNFQSGYAPFKRAFDVLFTLLLAPLLLPLLLLVALLVWTDGRRPVLFWQERIGRSGQPFRLVKFRTMRNGSERAGPAFAQSADRRVTRLGALLRKYRLDELPQFWNVLRGEMSIIGPRPEQFAFAADFEESIPLYPLRHWVRPGISGWAQVNQGYAADLGQTVEKLRFDLYYVKHLSPGLDVRIVVKTLHTILTGFGAR